MLNEGEITPKRIFLALSAIIAFIVDIVALFQIFGVTLILKPASINAIPSSLPVNATGSITSEAVTFVIWLYLFFATLITYFFLVDNPSVLASFLGYLFSAMTPLLLTIWLWVYGHIPEWLYVFLIPGSIFMGIAWYIGLTVDKEGNSEIFGCILMLLGVGMGILWFRKVYDWSIFWIIAIAVVAWVIGGASGFLPANLLRDMYHPGGTGG